MEIISISATVGAIAGLPFYFLRCDVRIRMLLWLFTFLGATFGAMVVLGASPVSAAPEDGTNKGGMNIEPVSPDEVAKGMESLANDISSLAGGMAVPMTLMLLFLAIITFLVAILFKKARGIAVGFLLMALVFFLVFGDLKATVNFVVGALEWIKGHF
jgi:hypothetical protein